MIFRFHLDGNQWKEMENMIKEKCKRIAWPYLFVALIFVIFALYFRNPCIPFINISARELVNSIASILALPSFIMPFVVLDKIKITPENLNAYFLTRKKKDADEKRNRNRAEMAFKDMYKEIEDLVGVFKDYYRNELNSLEKTKSAVSKCQSEYKELEKFFCETHEYIYDKRRPELYDVGDLKDRYTESSKVETFNSADIEKLQNALAKLNKKMFYRESRDEASQDKQAVEILKLLFDDNSGLMIKYMKLCRDEYNEL